MTSSRFACVALLVFLLPAGCGGTGADDEDLLDDAAPEEVDASTPTGGGPGATCGCDTDCAAVEGHDGVCVMGVCMTRASGACTAAGSTSECGAGSVCYGIEGREGAICWPQCDSYDCAGACATDGVCEPRDGMDCDRTCGSYCSPEPVDVGVGPGPGPGPDCPDLPQLACVGGEAFCGALIPWDPHQGPGYDDYPLNGETAANQYRSFLRRDTQMVIAYATAKVACKAAAWTFGNGGPLGLGDQSEANGAIPGTSIGEPGHPAGTHTNGHDIDLGYYQVSTPDNRLRPICEHVSGGADAYHCLAPPDTLDPWRSALFLGALFEHPDTRIVGADGKAGPLLLAALDTLCADGWITPATCANVSLGFEETDMGYGWFLFHHHHMHVSFSGTSSKPDRLPRSGHRVMECMGPGCRPLPLRALSF